MKWTLIEVDGLGPNKTVIHVQKTVEFSHYVCPNFGQSTFWFQDRSILRTIRFVSFETLSDFPRVRSLCPWPSTLDLNSNGDLQLLITNKLLTDLSRLLKSFPVNSHSKPEIVGRSPKSTQFSLFKTKSHLYNLSFYVLLYFTTKLMT